MDPCYSWTFIESFWFVLPSAVLMQDSKMIIMGGQNCNGLVGQTIKSHTVRTTQHTDFLYIAQCPRSQEGCPCSKNLPAVITIKYAPMLQILPGVSENPPLVSKHVRTNIFGNAWQNWHFRIGLTLFDLKQLLLDNGNIVHCTTT